MEGRAAKGAAGGRVRPGEGGGGGGGGGKRRWFVHSFSEETRDSSFVPSVRCWSQDSVYPKVNKKQAAATFVSYHRCAILLPTQRTAIIQQCNRNQNRNYYGNKMSARCSQLTSIDRGSVPYRPPPPFFFVYLSLPPSTYTYTYTNLHDDPHFFLILVLRGNLQGVLERRTPHLVCTEREQTRGIIQQNQNTTKSSVMTRVCRRAVRRPPQDKERG